MNVLNMLTIVLIAAIVIIALFFVVKEYKKAKVQRIKLTEQILEHNSDISLAMRDHVEKCGDVRISSLCVVKCDGVIYTKDMSSKYTGIVEFHGINSMAEHLVVNGETLQIRKYDIDFICGLRTFSLYGLVYYPYFEIRIPELKKMSVKQLKTILDTTMNIKQKTIN